MLALLVAVRDLLLAAALAWIGFALDNGAGRQGCAGAPQTCERAR